MKSILLITALVCGALGYAPNGRPHNRPQQQPPSQKNPEWGSDGPEWGGDEDEGPNSWAQPQQQHQSQHQQQHQQPEPEITCKGFIPANNYPQV